ncbi:MAG: hypothetical protein IPJ34_38460 [Myxococcales bacterium]|nr:hypothetical protein [Myxococcales bacterium]
MARAASTLFAVPLACLLASCGSVVVPRLKARHAAEFSCTEDAVVVEPIGDTGQYEGTFKVNGCGVHAIYVCTHGTCVRNSEAQSTPKESEPVEVPATQKILREGAAFDLPGAFKRANGEKNTYLDPTRLVRAVEYFTEPSTAGAVAWVESRRPGLSLIKEDRDEVTFVRFAFKVKGVRTQGIAVVAEGTAHELTCSHDATSDVAKTVCERITRSFRLVDP